MEELKNWLNANKIAFKQIDDEVVEIEGLGSMFLADLSGVQSIFKGQEGNLQFNLMESPEVLIEEGICYAAFRFGRNYCYYDLREKFRFNILKYIGQRQVPQMNVEFVNLGIHTPYELLNGSGDLALWVRKVRYLDQKAIGICDRNTMAATLNLQKECAKAGIRHIFGYSFTLEHLDEKVDMKVYCQSQQGLRNLLRIQKEIMVDSDTQTITLPGLLSHAEGNILVLGQLSVYWMQQNPHFVALLEKAFDKVYYQFDVTEYKAERIDVEVLKAAQFFFNNFYIPEADSFLIEPVLICDNYYLDKDDARSKIILNKIACGAAHEQSDEQYFKDTDELYAMFRAIFDETKWNVEALFRRMCRHTVEIAEKAVARFETGKMYMPQYIMRPDEIAKYGTRHNMFIQLLAEGLVAKIPVREHARYQERLAEEIYIIESTNNVDYFLIQWDMVQEARRRNITIGIGRGSAGGSLVSYLLGIISIDPLQYDLIFSRFLVPERCGLNWIDEISIIGEDIRINPGDIYVEVNLNGHICHFYKDAEFTIKRDGKLMKVYADQLQSGDDILLDNRDLIWTLNEIGTC